MSAPREAVTPAAAGLAPRDSARAVALEILRRVEEDAAYPDPLLESLPVRGGLDARDRALTTELVYGTLRWQRWLDWQLDRVSHRPAAELPAWLRALLRSGAYQLAFLDRVPARAVVHEAVELAKRRRPHGVPRFVNAVLRALAALPRPWPAPASADGDPVETLALRVSAPTWLLRRWIARYGEAEGEALARALNEPPPLVLRINTLQATAAALGAALRAAGAGVEPGRFTPEALRVTGAGDPRALAPLRAGWCAVQDEAAILVGHALDPAPGETVADVGAAPGTKTTHLAQLMANRGRLLAIDRHPGRLRRLEAACRVMGATLVEAHAGGVETVAREAGAICDRVLVDAPCSNLGVLRRNPDGKWRRQEADLPALAAVQGTMLDAAAAMVRPGGVLVYATCSLEPEENEAVVAALRARRPDFVPDPLPAAVPVECRAAPDVLRTWPHRHATDGFTAHRLRRRP
jgi:16S rRNA (cytosine967-C5)-methyltransferase